MVEVKEEEEVYHKLQRYLNSLPVDYPETESGVEIKILKHMFTPQEAEIALKLKSIPQEPSALFRPFKKKGWTLEQLSDKLSKMGKKGSIIWIKNKEGRDFYSIASLAIGFFDFQLGQLTKEFAGDIDQYCDEGFISAMLENGTLQMRTIPIEKSVSVDYHVSNFDEIKTIVENLKPPIFLSPCICRQSKDVQEIGCDHPIETCINLGWANPRIHLNQGRMITKDEAIEVLRMAQQKGMVICPTNTQNPFGICCCCGCSCMFLENLKKFENPSHYINSNYFVEIDEQLCSGCGDCVDACHLNANSLNEKGISEVNLGYCFGCGICVPTCPNEARSLVKKDKELIPPEKFLDLYQSITQNKKKLRENRKSDKNYGRVKKIK
jgi:Pyruvate/2-oxoacid:ferredoxin oxidoreductase delta subunit